ncbi:MAG TPA: hypothetical protein VGX23_06045 [Actinocrinis sp.]|nr:hypothetical protein [Actinocrinis sp.]
MVSFEHTSDVVTEAARRLTRQAEHLGDLPLPTLRLLNVCPSGSGPRSSDPAQTPVEQIPMAEPVWRYLVRVGAGNRIMAATQWRKPGLAAEVYRDDPLYPDLEQAAVEELAGEFRWDQVTLGEALLRQPQSEEPWLAALIDRLLPRFRPRQNQQGSPPLAESGTPTRTP